MDRREFLKTSLAAAAGAALASGSQKAMASGAASVQPGSVFNQETDLTGFLIGSNIIVQYQTLSYNQPNTYGNALALWQASQVPYGQAPLSMLPIATSSTSGSQFIPNQINNQVPYTVGFATNSDNLNTVCSSLTFFPGRTDGVAFATQIHPAYIGSTSMVIHYQTPVGNQPASNGNWVGLWQSSSPSYNGYSPLAKAMVDSDANTGTVAINIPFAIGATYAVAYFVGERSTDMAASFTMTT